MGQYREKTLNYNEIPKNTFIRMLDGSLKQVVMKTSHSTGRGALHLFMHVRDIKTKQVAKLPATKDTEYDVVSLLK
eukprot:gene18993-6331_t